jgi:hypothetical protein
MMTPRDALAAVVTRTRIARDVPTLRVPRLAATLKVK